MQAKNALYEVDPDLADRVAPYRGGYLPEDRRELEQQLQSGELLGVAATNALRAGHRHRRARCRADGGIPRHPGLDVAADRPVGSREPRRARRAGRPRRPAGHLSRHPPRVAARRTAGGERLRRGNPYVVAPHLCAAAQEIPLTEDDFGLFDGDVAAVVASLEAAGYLRRRARGWFWTRRDRAVDLADIRSSGGSPVRVVEDETGRLVGTVDAGVGRLDGPQRRGLRAHGRDLSGRRLRPGRVCRRGRDRPTRVLDVRPFGDRHPDRRGRRRPRRGAEPTLCFGTVEVSTQVVGYLKRRSRHRRGARRGAADLPAHHLTTKAVWWTLRRVSRQGCGVPPSDVPGAAHAAEHASIGLLPLFATCDRWDIGGVSTALHEDTGQLTVFVYDGHPGGAGFAERGFDVADSMADRDPRGDRLLSVRRRLPVVRAVPQVRQRQQPARQARRDPPPRRAPRRPRTDRCSSAECRRAGCKHGRLVVMALLGFLILVGVGSAITARRVPWWRLGADRPRVVHHQHRRLGSVRGRSRDPAAAGPRALAARLRPQAQPSAARRDAEPAQASRCRRDAANAARPASRRHRRRQARGDGPDDHFDSTPRER